MALGADRRGILSLLLGEGVRLAVLGIVAGLAGSLAAARLVSSQLWGVSGFSLPIFAGAAFLAIVATLTACLIPAWHAAAASPMTSLRAS